MTAADKTNATTGLSMPVPLALLDDPLEFLLAEHLVQRQICSILLGFAADGGAPAGEAKAVARLLAVDMRLHHRDENEDVFPALRRRARPEDGIDALLDGLRHEHRRAENATTALLVDLRAEPSSGRVRFDERARRRMRAFAVAARRHLAVENGVVLALARLRLTRHDLLVIADTMRARRIP